MAKRVLNIIVETLIAAGAQRCYGFVGDTINHFTDTAARRKWFHCCVTIFSNKDVPIRRWRIHDGGAHLKLMTMEG
jgi:hypothetical protein